jgi:hypothetical protein
VSTRPLLHLLQVCVCLETASTHTGTNVSNTVQTLAAAAHSVPTLQRALERAPVDLSQPSQPFRLAVVQQPFLQLRTCLTWQKQTGADLEYRLLHFS